MKKDEVKVGATYSAKIGDQVVPVRITQEKWTGDKHTGWTGLNTRTNRPVRIKTAAKLRGEITSDHSEQSEPDVPAAPPTKQREKATKVKTPTPPTKAPRLPKPEKVRKVSGLDAAAQVLKDAGKPMNFKEITEAVIAAGWKTSGKTPAATLYASAIREIVAKGKDARFRKTERGMFEHSGVEG
jgi:hypothetical protein